MTIHSLYTIKDFCHTGSKTLSSFLVGQQFGSSVQAVELCPSGSASVLCVVVCSESGVYFCTIVKRMFSAFTPHKHEGDDVNVQNAYMVKGTGRSKIKDGKFECEYKHEPHNQEVFACECAC